MELPFQWRGTSGTVTIECHPNGDPAGIGCPPEAIGFPVCTATVQYPHVGYQSMFGWVQLVHSTTGAGSTTKFETDPFVLFGDAPIPYCWYGIEPTLFDAPFPPVQENMEWEANSFLATTPLEEVFALQQRTVVPLVGFSWGFDISNGRLGMRATDPLPLDRWNDHIEELRGHYPLWTFPHL